MSAEPMSLSESPEWQALAEHHGEIGDRHLRDLFAEDPGRGEALTCRAGDLYLDYSKNRLTAETIRLLVGLAERAGLRERTEAMFRGEHINTTEDRAVLHVALRDPRTSGLEVDGQDVLADVHEGLDRMGGVPGPGGGGGGARGAGGGGSGPGNTRRG